MSQQDFQEKMIDGVTYRVFPLPPLDALDLLEDLGRVVGPSLGVVVDGVGLRGIESVADVELSGPVIERAVSLFFERADKALVRRVTKQLAAVTTVVLPDGKAPQLDAVLDAHFRGKVFALLRWLAFAVQAQYADFSSAWSGVASTFAAALQARPTAAESSSHPGSGGTSGAS